MICNVTYDCERGAGCAVVIHGKDNKKNHPLIHDAQAYVRLSTLTHSPRLELLECLKYIFDFVFLLLCFSLSISIILLFLCWRLIVVNIAVVSIHEKIVSPNRFIGIYRMSGIKKHYTISIKFTVRSMIYLVNKTLFILVFSTSLNHRIPIE